MRKWTGQSISVNQFEANNRSLQGIMRKSCGNQIKGEELIIGLRDQEEKAHCTGCMGLKDRKSQDDCKEYNVYSAPTWLTPSYVMWWLVKPMQ